MQARLSSSKIRASLLVIVVVIVVVVVVIVVIIISPVALRCGILLLTGSAAAGALHRSRLEPADGSLQCDKTFVLLDRGAGTGGRIFQIHEPLSTRVGASAQLLPM